VWTEVFEKDFGLARFFAVDGLGKVYGSVVLRSLEDESGRWRCGSRETEKLAGRMVGIKVITIIFHFCFLHSSLVI